MVAVMLIDKTASFHAARQAANAGPAVLRQRRKVSYVPDGTLTALLPARVAIVDITLNDGHGRSTVSRRCAEPCAIR